MRGGALRMPHERLVGSIDRDAARRRHVTWLVAAIVLPFGVWLAELRGPLDHLRGAVPPGQTLYVASKLAGLTGFSLAILQLDLVVVRRYLPRHVPGGASFHLLHRSLGKLCTAALLVHALLFASAASVRAGHPAWATLWPTFDSGSFELGRSLGVLGLWIVLALVPLGIVATTRWQRRLPPWFTRLHACVVISVVLGASHGLWIGSEPFATGTLVAAGVLAPALMIPRERALAKLCRTRPTC